MGSSFSIVNDTNKPIWVSDGVCHAALWGTLGGVAALAIPVAAAGAAAAGAATAAAATAGVAEGGVLVGTLEGAVMLPAIAGVALPAATVAGLTAAQWTIVGTVSGLLSFTAGAAGAGFSYEDEQRILSAKKNLEQKLEGFTRVEPGEKYTKHGTLSLVWTAYVMYDDGKEAKRDCWTGPTDGSEHLYPVSEYF